MKTIKLQKHGIEIKTEEYTEAYNKIKEKYKKEFSDGWKLFESPFAEDLFGNNPELKKEIFGDGYVAIPCEQLKIDVENNNSRWLCLYSNSFLGSYGYVLDFSGSDGQVVLYRKLHENPKKDREIEKVKKEHQKILDKLGKEFEKKIDEIEKKYKDGV